MGTDVNLTQGILETLWKVSGVQVQLTQGILEILSVSSANIEVSASVQLVVSGVTVKNAIGLTPLTVSASWLTPVGTFTYNWTFELPTGSSTSANVTRIASAGSGVLDIALMSAFLSNALGSNVASSIPIYVRNVRVPNPFDGKFQESNQAKRRVWPL